MRSHDTAFNASLAPIEKQATSKTPNIHLITMRSRSLLRLWTVAVLAILIGSFTALSNGPDKQPVGTESGNASEPVANPKLPTLWIIGDSTVKVGSPNQRGWGDEIAPFLDLSKINVVNRAIPGRSSRSFLNQGNWDDILKPLKAGDIVIMQFGHNDSSPVNEPPPITPSTRARGTIPGNGEETQEVDNILTGKHEVVHSYGWYLRNVITTAKAKGAVAVVCSPIPKNVWSKDDKSVRRASTYGLWAKEAAEQEHAFFVDLNEIIARSYDQMGHSAVDPFFADKVTHTTLEGAKFNARSVVSGLNGLNTNPLAFALSDEGKAVPAYHP